MDCECVACVLEARSGRGETSQGFITTRSHRVPVGAPVQHNADAPVRIVCPHEPGCGGCDIHSTRDSFAPVRGFVPSPA